MLKIPLNCCREMVIAVPAMKPTMAACDRKSVMNPNLHKSAHAFKTLDLRMYCCLITNERVQQMKREKLHIHTGECPSLPGKRQRRMWQ
jgi:hypothetical protein